MSCNLPDSHVLGKKAQEKVKKLARQMEKLRGGYPAEGIPAAFFHI